MPPLTSVAELRALLHWPDVIEETPVEGFRLFAARPGGGSLSRIEFLFDDKVTWLQQLGFGPWHGHYTEWSDERRNVRRAIATARNLVSGARCLLVERGTGGGGGSDEYLGSGVYRRGELPLTLSRGFQRLERLVFNAPAQDVAVDLSQYHLTKSGSHIEHGLRRRLKALYAGTALGEMYD